MARLKNIRKVKSPKLYINCEKQVYIKITNVQLSTIGNIQYVFGRLTTMCKVAATILTYQAVTHTTPELFKIFVFETWKGN